MKVISETGHSLTPPDQALAFFLSQAQCQTQTELVPLLRAGGRVLAQDQCAQVFSPPANNSAVDGYAVNSHDLDMGTATCLPLQQRISAGEVGSALLRGSCARIFTGAVLPDGADAVVMQEQCRVSAAGVMIPPVLSGENVRLRGEDFKQDDLLLRKGSVLYPQHVALLAAMGLAQVPVFKPLRIAVFSSGNELVEPGHALAPGQIFNSNRYLLASLLQQLGCD
ncbi:MAG TPA: molybdopterin molybdotransferase MoeA, partial [Pseudomonadales bacterium]|nr:molybdopterin molybdotransferase MoeA [Pseudomonadales bacterium]